MFSLINLIWGGKNQKVVGLVGGGWAVRLAKVVWLVMLIRVVRLVRVVKVVELVKVNMLIWVV